MKARYAESLVPTSTITTDRERTYPWRKTRRNHARYQFSDERKALIGAEFLDKVIQMPVYLYPLAFDQVRSYVEALPLPDPIKQQAHSLSRTMLANPRKIKRICNLISLNLAVREQDKRLANLIDPDVLSKLIVIQVQDPLLYQDIREMLQLPEYLFKVFNGTIGDVTQPANYQGFGALADRARTACLRSLAKGGWLKEVFVSGKKIPVGGMLQPYLTMLPTAAF